jgi:hypothetical protein
MYQADSWEDMKDDAGNTLNIGKLEYKTKHGKKPGSILDMSKIVTFVIPS